MEDETKDLALTAATIQHCRTESEHERTLWPVMGIPGMNDRILVKHNWIHTTSGKAPEWLRVAEELPKCMVKRNLIRLFIEDKN